MNKYIYKVKEKINIQVDEEGIETYETRDIEPKLLASVPVIQPKEQTVIDEEGIEITFTPEIDITRHYPIFDSELMAVYDVNLEEEATKAIKEKPVVIEPAKPYIPTKDEELEILKLRMIDIAREMAIAKELEVPCWINLEDLQEEKNVTIKEHKELSELIAKGE